MCFTPESSFSGNCDYPDQLDSAGRRCGGRAASVRPGGRLGGDGKYTDSFGRQRVYGPYNDPYDKKNNDNPLHNENPFRMKKKKNKQRNFGI